MGRLTLWYRGLGKSARTILVAAGVVVLLAVVGSIGYMLFYPQKVQVRYGTIVRDPVDGHVWEDNTRTIWVDPAQAGSYRIEYVDRLSPENEQKLAEEKAALARVDAENPAGLTRIQAPIPDKTLEDIETLQYNIEAAGSSLISGMEMAAEISNTKSALVSYRNQLAGIAVPAELEPIKQQGLQIFDMYIQACDLYLQGIANSDMSAVQQASSLINEANSRVRGLIPSQ